MQIAKQICRKYGIFLVPFLPILLLLRILPMMYDGWHGAYAYTTYGPLPQWFRYVFVSLYNYVNGRVSSNFIAGILESFRSEIPFDIVNALIFVGLIFCICKLTGFRRMNLIVLLYTALLLLTPAQIRVYVIQIAPFQYVTPILRFFWHSC